MPVFTRHVKISQFLWAWWTPAKYVPYYKKVKESRLFALLVTPSLISTLCSIAIVCLIALASQWHYLQLNSLTATYFAGDYGLNTLFMRINFFLGLALDSTLAYNIAAIGFACLVGLSIYSIVQGFHYMHTEALVMHDEIKFTTKRVRRRVEAVLGLRILLQITSVLAVSLYSAFFFNAILPYCISLMNSGYSNVIHVTEWLEALVILFLALHVFCIFMRLLVLRPRLFSSVDTLHKT